MASKKILEKVRNVEKWLNGELSGWFLFIDTNIIIYYRDLFKWARKELEKTNDNQRIKEIVNELGKKVRQKNEELEIEDWG